MIGETTNPDPPPTAAAAAAAAEPAEAASGPTTSRSGGGGIRSFLPRRQSSGDSCGVGSRGSRGGGGGGGGQGGAAPPQSRRRSSTLAAGLRRFSSGWPRRSSSLGSMGGDGDGEGDETPFERDLTKWARKESARRSSGFASTEGGGGGEAGGPGPRGGGPPRCRCADAASRRCRSFARKARVAASHPRIALSVLLTFVAVCAVGITAVVLSGRQEREEAGAERMDEAAEMTFRVDDELKKALLPLFTMEEMARQGPLFKGLPPRIEERRNAAVGSGGGDGSSDDGRVDVRGVCDDPALVAEYDRIAASVKESADMPGALVNIRLSPAGVTCLAHPLNNTADFNKTGNFLDSSASIGRDLLGRGGSPPRFEDARIQMEGPARASAGLDARLLSVRDSTFVDAENATKLFWGFVSVVLNWDRIEADLDLYGFFEGLDMEFKLIREGDEEAEADEIVIAESANSHLLTPDNSVREPIRAFDSEWALVMGDPSPAPVQGWVIGGSVAVAVVALISSLALMVILVTKHEHELLLYRMMPKKIIRKIQRGETVIKKYDDATLCFFDIVSFTTISGAMKAEEVMQMLRVLYTEFDRLAEKHGVLNVETIGDAYIVIGGGPERCEDAAEGAAKVACFALDAIAATRNLRFHDNWKIEIRAGLASGLVVAGVVGTELVPKLTLFGNTVTLGEILEAGSEAMKVHCSARTRRLLRRSDWEFRLRRRDDGKTFRCNHRVIKETYWVDGVVSPGEINRPPRKQQTASVGEDGGPVGDRVVVGAPQAGGGGEGDDDDASDDDGGSFTVEFRADEFRDEDDDDLSDVDLQGPAPAPVPAPQDGDDASSEGQAAGTADGGNSPDAAEGEGAGGAGAGAAALGRRRTSFSVEQLLDGQKEGGSGGGGVGSSAALSHETDGTPNRSGGRFTSMIGRKTRQRDSVGKPSDETSVTSTTSSALADYWSGLGDDAWQEGSMDGSERKESGFAKCCSAFRTYASLKLKACRQIISIAVGRKEIILVTFVTFAALMAAGLSTVLVFAADHEESLQNGAVQKAEDADRWLLNELRKSLLPLFAMAELVKNLGSIFDDMPDRIENRTVLTDVRPFYWRNTTGICDAPEKLKPFNEMAASIKNRSDLGRILVNIQLAPHGVLCLTHPKNNTQDFDDGAFLDTSFAIGLDLINDPTRSAVSRATVKEDRYTIQGPIPLVQGKRSVVDEAIISRYPVRDPDHFIIIDGQNYSFWGHTVTLMDWDKLKKKFGINEFFGKDGMEYKMTRTDTVRNETTGEKYFQVKIIAESERSSVLTEENSVSVELETADNGWVLSVGYESGFSPSWKVWGCVLVVLGSLFLSFLLLMVLVTTTEHELLLYRMMPREAVNRLQRGETIVERDSLATIFFSHIVGFTALSGEMKPADFMLMLNQIYGAFDRLVIKHQVSKVETIGACYIVTAPGPEKSYGREGAVRVALFALDAMDFVNNYRYKEKQIFIQAGIASGPVVSGVIGAALPKYTIFGDTVNFASRMDSTGKAQKIQCSEKTQHLLNKSLEFLFNLEERLGENGERGIQVKGKGLKYTWWINGAQAKQSGRKRGSRHGSRSMKDLAETGAEIAGGDANGASSPPVPTEEDPSNPRRRVSFSD